MKSSQSIVRKLFRHSHRPSKIKPSEKIFSTPKYWHEEDGIPKMNRDQPTLFDLATDPKYSMRIQPYTKSSHWNLVGNGKPKVDCGEIRAKTCNHTELHPEHKTLVRYYKKSCLQKSCPVCVESWASSDSIRSLFRLACWVVPFGEVKLLQGRLLGEFKGKKSKGYYDALITGLEAFLYQSKRKPVHWMLSPPVDTKIDKKRYPSLRELAYSIAKGHGFKGGVVIFHPFRLKCSACGHAIPDHKKACLCGCDQFE